MSEEHLLSPEKAEEALLRSFEPLSNSATARTRALNLALDGSGDSPRASSDNPSSSDNPAHAGTPAVTLLSSGDSAPLNHLFSMIYCGR